MSFSLKLAIKYILLFYLFKYGVNDSETRESLVTSGKVKIKDSQFHIKTHSFTVNMFFYRKLFNSAF